jgi:DNA-binding transcriptional LysR family regulator
MPTPAGKIFYERAKEILNLYSNMENAIYEIARKVKGRLSIGATMTAAIYPLPQAFYSFSKLHPDVQIELSVLNTE